MAICLVVLASSSLIHTWFDPLMRWKFPSGRIEPGSKPLLAYIPGLDGGNGSPFVQFPGLAADFDVRVQQVNFESDANLASYDVIVDDAATYLRQESRDRPLVVMGESYGGIIASGLAARHPELVSGLVLVNPATALSVMPELRDDVRWIRFGGVPDSLLNLALFAKVGRKTFDSTFLAGAVREILVDRKLEKLRAEGTHAASRTLDLPCCPTPAPLVTRSSPCVELWTDPGLAGYYDTALEDFIGQLTASKSAEFWRGRLAQLEAGCDFVEGRLSSLTQPVLVVAGTADRLLASEQEAARLSRQIPLCDVHLVQGAGHAGTLDERVDLPAVVRKWAARRTVT